MDYEEMLRHSTDGQYWTNSSFALTSILMHSTEMWHLNNLVRPTESFVEISPFLSENIRAKLKVRRTHYFKNYYLTNRIYKFQDDIQECDSVFEFLFDPWVLVQSIHYPSVLYQWLIAAYSEMLRFYQQISDFFFLQYPKSFQANIVVLKTIQSGKSTILRYCYVLQNLIFIHRSPFRTSDFKSALDEMQEELDTFLHQLRKVRSAKGQNVIKALKRLCWNDPNPGPLEQIWRDPGSGGCAFYESKLYYRKYWESGFLGHFFLPAMTTTICPGDGCISCLKLKEGRLKERQEFEEYYKTSPNYKCLSLTLDKMVQFYNDHMEDRFPPEAKTDSVLVHLVDKEILFLQWKFDSVESTQLNHQQIQLLLLVTQFAYRFEIECSPTSG